MSGASAASAKSKAAAKKAAATHAAADATKKKPAELLIDDRAINKQMQWEDKVMGSDAAKKAELAKIARAQAITKAAEAAAEKAAASAPPPAPLAAAKPNKSTVNLPSLADEGDKSKRDERGAKNREISPRLSTTEATAVVPPPKPADDKFIDKIMASEGKKKTVATKTPGDGELEQLLTKENDKAPGQKRSKVKRKDSVDDLLENASKAPVAAKSGRNADVDAMEPLATPPPLAPVAVKRPMAVKHDDGIIHVVQGANYSAPGAARSAAAPTMINKQETAIKATNWKDPFADNPSARKMASTLPAPATTRSAPPAPRIEKAASVAASPPAAAGRASGWKDPFADPSDSGKPRSAPVQTKVEPKRKAVEAPSHAAGWKDPFADNGSERGTALSDSRHRELSTSAPSAVVADPPESKWKVAARHPVAPKARAATVDGRSRWSVLKKR
ncbi:MAG TPA: hypothetical protein VH374_00195 [Polyangia bacterium]|jgi:hypothetical protein|nr:hypothetical protein [Polyangia bacterium]